MRQHALLARAAECVWTHNLAFVQEGTRANPIPILSVEDERIVGISLPVWIAFPFALPAAGLVPLCVALQVSFAGRCGSQVVPPEGWRARV
jgi:hypothetical protein